jgi:hypothetical protein
VLQRVDAHVSDGLSSPPRLATRFQLGADDRARSVAFGDGIRAPATSYCRPVQRRPLSCGSTGCPSLVEADVSRRVSVCGDSDWYRSALRNARTCEDRGDGVRVPTGLKHVSTIVTGQETSAPDTHIDQGHYRPREVCDRQAIGPAIADPPVPQGTSWLTCAVASRTQRPKLDARVATWLRPGDANPSPPSRLCDPASRNQASDTQSSSPTLGKPPPPDRPPNRSRPRSTSPAITPLASAAIAGPAGELARSA